MRDQVIGSLNAVIIFLALSLCMSICFNYILYIGSRRSVPPPPWFKRMFPDA